MRTFAWFLRLGACLSAVSVVAACSVLGGQTGAHANRPDGEGYAGVGQRLVRIGVPGGDGSWYQNLAGKKSERAAVELWYKGLDSGGRALFERRDVDALAGTSDAPKAPAQTDAAAPTDPNTREIVLDMRLARQLHIQGKIIEILEATSSGVVFRLY